MNIFDQIENIFNLTLFSGGAKHGPGCKIFSENHLHPKQTQPNLLLLLFAYLSDCFDVVVCDI